MSGQSSPVNGGYEAARLTVRKDLFPDVRLSKLASAKSGNVAASPEEVSCVKLETDFEQSIDDIAKQKLKINGTLSSKKSRHKKHKQHSRHDSEVVNGHLSSGSKRKKHRHRTRSTSKIAQVKSGKDLSLVSSSKGQKYDSKAQLNMEEEQEEEDDKVNSESSEDEVLKCSVKLPIINLQRQSGKPYSHELSQLSSKKSKKSSKEKRTHVVPPCSGKPRSMLDICSRSKKKSKKSECTTTYQSQIIGTNSMKIKIKKTSINEIVTPTPTSVADLGLKKSKKKRAASPVSSESSGEEYDPSRGDTAAAISVAAPKPRNNNSKTPKIRKPNNTKKKTERNRVRTIENKDKDTGPQSPWAQSLPKEILVKIFEYVVASQGTLPAVVRMSRVCKLWYSVSCLPELWRNVDLAQYTIDKCKIDYKLVWLLENRLSQCQNLNIAQWKISNVSWVLTCVAECCPGLVELSLAGWCRLTPDQLFDLLQALPKLQRIDLSQTSETGSSSSCLAAISMARMTETFGKRLTHLTMANNTFSSLPQILSSVGAHCQNLEVLDISGACATSHPASIPLEALQKGCPKMRVFRAANSQVCLSNATTSQQMEAKGWEHLEELSIAGEPNQERVGVGEYRLGDEALARLVRGATLLKLLDLRGLQRLTDSGLVRVPAWDLQHLFLGGCNVTRQNNACLELICEKWSHSLVELDLSWASATRPLDDAASALASAPNSNLKTLNLCGSSVSLEAVKKVLLKCPLESVNLSSCRALPRGMKRLYAGKELQDLKDSLNPEWEKLKEKTKDDKDKEKGKTKKPGKTTETDSKLEKISKSPDNTMESSLLEEVVKSPDKSTSFLFQEPKSVADLGINVSDKQTSVEFLPKASPDSKTTELPISKDVDELVTSILEGKPLTKEPNVKLLSPTSQLRPDSSSTPRSEPAKCDFGSPHFSPVSKPDSQAQTSPEVQTESLKKSNSWNTGQFKTTPNHKSEASPLNRFETTTSKIRSSRIIEQCSPTTSQENKRSPEINNMKLDIKNPNNWNYCINSPMPRQDNQFTCQRSPYSAQPSPAQPSPYSTQPSPYSAQPSPYSSQPSPYSAQPSPDTSQIVKPDISKSSGAWNTGNYSPMTKHHSPFSPHPSTHPSPDPGLGIKSDVMRNTPNKTPGQYSPMSRQDRMLHSPYSPRPSVDTAVYNNKKSPGVGNYSPMMRPDYHLPSPDRGPSTRVVISGRGQDNYGRTMSKITETIHNLPTPDIPGSWGMEKFNPLCAAPTSTIETLVWGTSSFNPESQSIGPRVDNIPTTPSLNTPPPQPWTELPPFNSSVRRHNEDLSDPWSVGQFHVEPPHQMHNNFVEQTVNFDSLSSHHTSHQSHSLSNFLDDSFSETSRAD